MVFTIEPRLTVPGRGVATIEDMILVTETWSGMAIPSADRADPRRRGESMRTVERAPRFGAAGRRGLRPTLFGFPGRLLLPERARPELSPHVRLRRATDSEDRQPGRKSRIPRPPKRGDGTPGGSGGDPLPVPAVISDTRGRSIAGNRGTKTASPHAVRMVTFIEGTPLGTVHPRPLELLADLGASSADRPDGWLPSIIRPPAGISVGICKNGERIVRENLPLIGDPARSGLAVFLLETDDGDSGAPLGPPKPRSVVVYNDANDFNVIVGPPEAGAGRPAGGGSPA